MKGISLMALAPSQCVLLTLTLLLGGGRAFAISLDEPVPQGDTEFSGEGIESFDLQDPELGLGSWSDPTTKLGRARSYIAQAAKQDPEMKAWFCEMDEKIKKGDVGLAGYSLPDTDEGSVAADGQSNVGLADLNTAGISKD